VRGAEIIVALVHTTFDDPQPSVVTVSGYRPDVKRVSSHGPFSGTSKGRLVVRRSHRRGRSCAILEI
jgi:hypothetical protein